MGRLLELAYSVGKESLLKVRRFDFQYMASKSQGLGLVHYFCRTVHH